MNVGEADGPVAASGGGVGGVPGAPKCPVELATTPLMRSWMGVALGGTATGEAVDS